MKKSAITPCVKGAHVGRQLGKGSHATVWEFASSGALKVVKSKARSLDETNRLLSSVRHEIYIHKHVPGLQKIAPELRSHWKCHGMYFFLYPRYQGDMKALGEKQFMTCEQTKIKKSRVYEQVLYTEDQLLTMFRLAKELGQRYRVIHGDLRMEQFFYKKGGKEIAVADFGFSGHFPTNRKSRLRYAEWGWFLSPGNDEVNDALNTKLPPTKTLVEEYVGTFNQFQLLADLTANGVRCFVKMKAKGEIRILAPDKRLSNQFRGDQEMQYVTLPRGFKRYHIHVGQL